jgi:hypothetical protein
MSEPSGYHSRTIERITPISQSIFLPANHLQPTPSIFDIKPTPEKGAEWLRAGVEARLADLYQQWQALRLSTARFAELLGVSPWELDDLLRARGLKVTNLPG